MEQNYYIYDFESKVCYPKKIQNVKCSMQSCKIIIFGKIEASPWILGLVLDSHLCLADSIGTFFFQEQSRKDIDTKHIHTEDRKFFCLSILYNNVPKVRGTPSIYLQFIENSCKFDKNAIQAHNVKEWQR